MTKSSKFNAALDNFLGIKSVNVIAPYDDVAEMSRAVDEFIANEEVSERAALWAAVAKTEAIWRDPDAFCKIDGREG